MVAALSHHLRIVREYDFYHSFAFYGSFAEAGFTDAFRICQPEAAHHAGINRDTRRELITELPAAEPHRLRAVLSTIAPAQVIVTGTLDRRLLLLQPPGDRPVPSRPGPGTALAACTMGPVPARERVAVDGMARARRRTAWMLVGIYAVLTAVVALWLLRDPTEFIRDRLDINAQALRIPVAWVLALAVAVGYSLYTMWAVPFVRQHLFELSKLKLLGIWVAIISGIVEEIVFRQMLMDLVASWGRHAVDQVLVSAIAFGLIHTVWVLFRGEFAIAVPVIASTTALGALLAIVYLTAGRNVLPSITAHILINLAIEPWLVLAAMSKMWAPRGSTG